MKKNSNGQKRISGKCEMLFQQEVRECCAQNGQYSDNVIRSVRSAVLPKFIHKLFPCKDERNFLLYNADIIMELVKRCLTRNLTHFRRRDRKRKRGAAALCRKAVSADFVIIGSDHKYTKYKPSIERLVNEGIAVNLAG